ncbi:hypothetical protein BH10BAC4_BH10BAC4_25060 [soil metagenome]
MTTERIKSIGILISTLIIGVLLGLLIPGFYHKYNGGHGQSRQEMAGHRPGGKGDWFANTLNKIVEPDSLQREKIKPVTSWAASRMDSIEQNAHRQAGQVLDSVRTQLRPIITDEQWNRLEKFDQQAKTNWHGRGKDKGR